MFKLVNKEMAGTFQFSIVAGEVCSTLDLLKAGQSFQVRDENVLNHAIRFLSNAQEGRRFTQNLELSERAFDASEAYGETVKVLRANVRLLERDKKTLEEIIDSLKNSLEEIKRTQKITEDQAYNNLKEFFSAIRQFASEQRSRPYEKIEILTQKEQ